jgi:acyl carrier protein
MNSKKKNINIKLSVIFYNIFKDKKLKLDQIYFGKTPMWDSLHHLKLIIFLEREFSIKIKIGDVYKLSSFKKIEDYLLKNT